MNADKISDEDKNLSDSIDKLKEANKGGTRTRLLMTAITCCKYYKKNI